jgi:hypothetical protein
MPELSKRDLIWRPAGPLGLDFNRQPNPKDTPPDACQIAAAQGCLFEIYGLESIQIFASIDFVHAAWLDIDPNKHCDLSAK